MLKKISRANTIGTIISLLLIIYFIGTVTSAFEIKTNNKAISEASEALVRLKRESNEIYAIQKELNKLYALISEEKCNNDELEKKCKSFKDSGLDFVNLRFFDKGLNLIKLSHNNNKDLLSAPMQRLYTSLANFRLNKDNNRLKTYGSLFETLLGAIDLKKLAQETSTLIPVTLKGKPGYIYWNFYEQSAEENNISGMLAWIRTSDIPQRFLCQKLVDKFNIESATHKKNQIFGFVDKNVNGFLYPDNLLQSVPNFYYAGLIIKLSELKACLKTHDDIGSYLFSYTEIGNDRYFFCLTPNRKLWLSRILVILFQLLLFAITAYFCIFDYKFFKILSPQNSHKSNEITKNLGLAKALITLFTMIFLVYINSFIVHYTKMNLKHQVFYNLTNILDWIDESYTLAKDELSQKLINLSKDAALSKLEPTNISEIAKELSENNLLDRLYLTNKEGKILFSYPKEEKDSIFNKIIPVAARKIAEERLGSEENWQSRIDDLMVNSISKSFSDLLGEGANNLLRSFEAYDKVSELDFGNKKHLVFSTIIKRDPEEPLVLITWLDSNKFGKQYLLDKIKDSESLPEDLRKVTLAMVPTRLDNLPYPAEIAKYSFTRDITERVAFTKRLAEFESEVWGSNIYGVAAQLGSVPGYVVFALQSE